MSRDRSKEIKSGIQTFLDHVKSLESAGDDGFVEEYGLIQDAQVRNHRENVSTMNVGKSENNLKKNRYKDILPYDDYRIVLSLVNDDQYSDYINASRIEGVKGRGDYIASQGPLAVTVNDFWRMIWEYNVEIIFMACRVVEMGKIKCKQYWADLGKAEEFGDIMVFTAAEEDIMSDCVRRNFRVTKGDEVRYVIQFHYSGWPDHGIPEDPAHIRDMIGFMREARQNSIAPLVVHCSAGCGRTGAIIAVDYVWTLLEQGKFDENFSLFDLICRLREQRMSLVQTPDQYAVVNKVLRSLCEDWMTKMSSHTYENVELNQEMPDFGDSKPVSEDNIYEDVWSLAKMADAKKSIQSPQENQFIEQRHVGKAEEIQVSQLEKNDNASPIYENLNTEQKKEKKHLQSQLSDSGHSQKQVYKTIIQTGPRSPTKKVEFSGIEEVPQSGRAGLAKTAPVAPTLSSTAPRGASTIVFRELTRETKAHKPQALKKDQPVSGKESDNSSGWKKMKAFLTLPGGLKYDMSPPQTPKSPNKDLHHPGFPKSTLTSPVSPSYYNQNIPANYSRADFRRHPDQARKMATATFPQVRGTPHRSAVRSHSSGPLSGAKPRNFSTGSEVDQRLERSGTTLNGQNQIVSTDPRYKGYVLLNQAKSSAGRQQSLQPQQPRQPRQPQQYQQWKL